MTNRDYQAVCRENAERFLKTAFVLDDIPEKVDRVQKQKVTSLTKPSKGVPLAPPNDEGLTETPETSLNCEILIEMFMQKGIVCSIIQPEDKDRVSHLRDILVDAVENVDLPILDWNLFKDDGDTIISILKQLIEDRSYPEGRVALILIYTREPIRGAMGRLEHEFEKLIPDQDRDNVLAMKGLRIVFVDRLSVVEEKLPDLIIDEFSEAHQGILENSVMQAIYEIREKTFYLLSRFPAILDAPFIANRAALKEPDDSSDQVFDLITSEIHSLLTQSMLPDNIIHDETIPHIFKRITDSELRSILKANCPNDKLQIIRKELLDLISNGVYPIDRYEILFDGQYSNLKTPNNDKKKKDLISALSKLLAGDGSDELDAEFSELMSFQHKYPDFSPQLTLGTIVYKTEGRWAKNYFVCIMPVCDCERLAGKVSFPFLPLEMPTNQKPSFDLTISHGGIRKRGRINYSIDNIKQFKFKPTRSSKGRIIANDGVFETVSGATLEWVGVLKREFAQRMANRFGTEISRVGLNEPEWQRLSTR